MHQIGIDEKNKKTSKVERLFICNNSMVRQLDTVWNQFEASLRVMYEKLARLDVVIVKGEVVYLSREEVRNVWL